jgi:hypothetical protein
MIVQASLLRIIGRESSKLSFADNIDYAQIFSGGNTN